MRATKVMAVVSLALALVGCKGGEKSGDKAAGGSEAVPANAASSGEQVINLYTWADYFTPEILAGFSAATGIRVQLDTYDSNEALMGKLEAGASGYDVILPSDYTVTILSKREKLEKLDHSKLPNLANIEDAFRNPAYDPGLAYSVPFQWGTSGIGYLEDKVSAPIESWEALMKPSEQSKGRISLLKDMREVFAIGLKYKGYSVNSQDEAQIADALKVMSEQRTAADTLYNSENYKDLLAQGEVWIAHGWSSSIAMAKYGANSKIKYVIPKEGSLIWVDTMAIPRKAPHLEQAYAFINYFLDGKPSAAVSNSTYGSSPNRAARAFIKPEVLADPALYPPAEVLSRTEYLADVGNATRAYDRAWTELRAQ